MNNTNFESLLITKNKSIRNAMRQLDESAEKNLYVVDQSRRLLGSLSDGDIRRGILQGIDLEESIESIMNSSPKYVIETDYQKETKTKKLMLDYGIETVPLVDHNKVIIKVAFWVEVFQQRQRNQFNKKPNKVFVVAGGIGSRLEPFTRILPKPLVPIGEQPIIEKIMDKFLFYGFQEFILSVLYKAEMIKLYFSDSEIRDKYSDISFIKEEQPLGTIGSLYLAKDHFTESFYITNSDILVEEDLDRIYKFHEENDSVLTIVGCVKNSVIPYGVLKTDENGLLVTLEEKPAYKHIINTGVYVAKPEIIDYIQPNQRKDMNELIEDLLRDKKKISIYPILDDQWFDIGQWAEYESTRKYFENK